MFKSCIKYLFNYSNIISILKLINDIYSFFFAITHIANNKFAKNIAKIKLKKSFAIANTDKNWNKYTALHSIESLLHVTVLLFIIILRLQKL